MIDRSKNSVLGTIRHAVACPFIQNDGRETCDCSPIDDAKAMTRDDLLRVFSPLPPREAGLFRYWR